MSIVISRCTDVPALMDWRQRVLKSVFGLQEVPPGLMQANEDYYLKNVESGYHIALVASDGQHEVGCGALCFQEELPSPDNPSGLCAYLMNIFVMPDYRRSGVGRAIVEALVDEARSRGAGKIWLETTEQGRTLYESLGFRQMYDILKDYL